MRLQQNKVGGGTHLLVGGVSLLTFLILGAMVFPTLPQTAQAEQVPSRVKLTVNPVISISLQNALTVDVLPTQDGTFSSNTTALSISTNNETGYSLYMATGNGENTLTSQNPGTSDVIAAVNGGDNGVTSAGFGNNTWGYNLSQEAVSDATAYKAVPTATGDTAIISTSSPTEADTYNLTFGTKVDTSLPSGTYSNDVVVSVVANPAFVPVFDGIQTMQEMTSTICADAAENDTAQLTDTRDGKQYWVTKLADGNCWMTQNLDLDITESGLSANDTDIDADWISSNAYPPISTVTSISQDDFYGSYDLGDYLQISFGGSSYDVAGNVSDAGFLNVSGSEWSDTYVANGEIISDWTTADQTNHTYDAHYLIGNYYSWMDATAGTGYGLTNGNASGSICPKNWHLPSQDDFSALIADLPQTIYPAISLPIALTMGGRIMDDRDAMEGFGSIVIYGANGRGGFWSSEASPNDIIAPPFLSIVTGPAVISGQQQFGGWAYPIRCLAR